MTLIHILVFALLALPFAFIPRTWRTRVVLIASLVALAWFLSEGGLTWHDSVIFGATLLLIVAVWWVVKKTSDHEAFPESDQQMLLLLAVFCLVVIVIGSQGKLSQASAGIMLIALVGISGAGMGRIALETSGDTLISVKRRYAFILIAGIIFILFVLKVPGWNTHPGFYPGAVMPIVWIGISYLAFRLIAILLDFRAGRLRLSSLSLQDLVVYALFFPAYTAGPIDRAQRFIPELNEAKQITASTFGEGSGRIAVGVFKKFVVADTLALVALSSTTFPDVYSTLGSWMLLYLYAFQIYFDFSGYSDVAIGLGRLYGITLPENFDRPYLQPNIQQFWQRWHITLSTWFRIYYFVPFSRMLIQSPVPMPQWVIVFLSQVTTMVLIGLWHGVTLNFVLWGMWHGVGLYLHKLMADNTRSWHKRISERVWTRRLLYGASVLTTFHFVVIGWVFFALPSTGDSLSVLAKLFGIGR